MTMQEKADAFDKILQRIDEKQGELVDLLLKEFVTVDDLDNALQEVKDSVSKDK